MANPKTERHDPMKVSFAILLFFVIAGCQVVKLDVLIGDANFRAEKQPGSGSLLEIKQGPMIVSPEQQPK